MKKLDIYQLENDFNYNCDHQERIQHINKLNLLKTREEQELYIELFSDIISSVL